MLLRGTYSNGDILTDLDAEAAQIAYGPGYSKTGFAHRGFLAQAAKVISKLFAHNLFEQACEVVFTGHSMGSALASICALVCESIQRNVEDPELVIKNLPAGLSLSHEQVAQLGHGQKIHALGICPPCCLSTDACQYSKDFVSNVVCYKDNVSRLSRYCIQELMQRAKWLKEGNDMCDYCPQEPL